MLSDEDKARIQAEEEFRAKAAKDAQKKASKKGMGCGGWFFTILAVFIVIGIFAPKDSSTTSSTSTQSTIDSGSEADSEPTPPPAAPKDNLELLSAKWESDSFTGYVVGKVKNNTSREYGYAQITFNLYDSEGNQIGTAMDNITNLKAGGTWAYKAMALAEGAARYEFAEITGY